MGVTTKKYGVSLSFCRKLAIYGKTVGLHIRILSENLKTRENSNTRPLCITDLKYGDHDQEILSYGPFLPQTGNFQKNRRLICMDFELKFGIFQNPLKFIYRTVMDNRSVI
jgi:hypothetical protein